MKTSTTNYLLTAAAMVLAAGTASAQTLTAEVPFSFKAGGKQMAPGTYRIVASQSAFSTPFIRLANLDDRKSLAMLPAHPQDAPRAWVKAGVPMLAFNCIDGKCSLAKVWNGNTRGAYSLNPVRRTDHMKLTMIPLVKAD